MKLKLRHYKEIRYPETVEILEKPKGHRTDIKCPDCKDGVLVVREGYSKFLGCSGFPKCRTAIGIQTYSDYGVGNIKALHVAAIQTDEWLRRNESDIYDDIYSPSFPGIHCADDMDWN